MAPAATPGPGPGLPEVARTARAVKQGWNTGKPCDAAAALREHPELAAYRSVVLDLAYEEFCQREAAGSPPDPAAFAARFPAYQNSLAGLLRDHLLLVRHPEFLAPPAWPEAGDRCEGLDVVAEIGRGTFGRAYLAHDPATDRACVLKLSAGGVAEARFIARFRHPHITDVYWARPVAPGLTGVCMPLVGVATLEHVRDAAFPPGGGYPADTGAILGAIDSAGIVPLPPPGPPVVPAGRPYHVGVAAIGARVAAALDCAHRAGVTHGDVKPSNVVLGPGGHPYLIDFNLAAAPAGGPLRVGGTLPYMAPEVLAAVAGAAPGPVGGGPAADLYSFGATLFEMLTGRVPYRPGDPPAESVPAALLARVRAGGAGIRSLAPGVPRELAAVIEQCLSPSPADRPASADEVRCRLELMASPRRPTASRRVRRRWPAVAAALTAGAAALWLAPPRLLWRPPSADWPTATTPEEFYDRGVWHLGADRVADAQEDFARAATGGNDTRAAALISYCLARRGLFAEAVATGRVAASEQGPAQAAVLNNQGYCLCRLRRPADAINPLNKALRLDPSLVPARYNRAMALYAVGLGPDFRLTDRRAAEDMAVVLGSRPQDGVVYYQAGRVFAALAVEDPGLRQQSVRCLADAVSFGVDPSGFAREPVLAAGLGGMPEFRRVCDSTPSGARVRQPPHHLACLVLPN